MKSVQDTYLLHNGVAIPCVGYGTCDTDGEVTVRSVKCALQAGYRLIDTATCIFECTSQFTNHKCIWHKVNRKDNHPRNNCF